MAKTAVSIRTSVTRAEASKILGTVPYITFSVGGVELAKRIDQIEKTLPDKKLREKLVKTVRTRLTELENLI